MLKTIGLCMIVVGSFGAAFWNNKMQNHRLVINEAMLDLVMYIKNRIIFFHEELNDIYAGYENKYFDKSGFLCELLEGDFNNALKKSGIIKEFDEKTSRRLFEFGNKLGRSAIDEQSLNCDMCMNALEEQLSHLREEIPKKGRMYSSLYIIGGLAAALLLI